MAKSKVLYIHVTGLSSEIMKNLVLAGIRAVLCDDRPYPESLQHTPTFFLERADRKKQKNSVAEAIRPKIEELNPLLGDCQVVKYSDLTDALLGEFSIVVCSRTVSIAEAIRISKATVNGGGKFYMVDSFGMAGGAAFDLGADHKYRPEQGKELLDETGLKQHVPLETMLLHVPLEDAINRFHKKTPVQWVQYRCLLEYLERTKTWPTASSASDFTDTITKWIDSTSPEMKGHEALTKEALDMLAMTASTELSPVCSVLGGALGNEIIKAISGKGEPANNTLLFDGISCKLWNFLVKPKD
jgi:ubiquitin-like 1-activating enzyme E1 A